MEADGAARGSAGPAAVSNSAAAAEEEGRGWLGGWAISRAGAEAKDVEGFDHRATGEGCIGACGVVERGGAEDGGQATRAMSSGGTAPAPASEGWLDGAGMFASGMGGEGGGGAKLSVEAQAQCRSAEAAEVPRGRGGGEVGGAERASGGGTQGSQPGAALSQQEWHGSEPRAPAPAQMRDDGEADAARCNARQSWGGSGAAIAGISSSIPPTAHSPHATAKGSVSPRGGERMRLCPEAGTRGGGGAQGMGVSARYTRGWGGGKVCRVMSSAQHVRESLSFVRTMCAARQKLGVSPMARVIAPSHFRPRQFEYHPTKAEELVVGSVSGEVMVRLQSSAPALSTPSTTQSTRPPLRVAPPDLALGDGWSWMDILARHVRSRRGSAGTESPDASAYVGVWVWMCVYTCCDKHFGMWIQVMNHQTRSVLGTALTAGPPHSILGELCMHRDIACVCIYTYVHVCAYVRERERERECVCVCVCVCIHIQCT